MSFVVYKNNLYQLYNLNGGMQCLRKCPLIGPCFSKCSRDDDEYNVIDPRLIEDYELYLPGLHPDYLLEHSLDRAADNKISNRKLNVPMNRKSKTGRLRVT